MNKAAPADKRITDAFVCFQLGEELLVRRLREDYVPWQPTKPSRLFGVEVFASAFAKP